MEPGYKKIRIQPTLTKGMTEVSATYESIYGTIVSAWSCREGKICVDVQIPVNTTAVIQLPEKEAEFTVGSGRYHYGVQDGYQSEIREIFVGVNTRRVGCRRTWPQYV